LFSALTARRLLLLLRAGSIVCYRHIGLALAPKFWLILWKSSGVTNQIILEKP
jgi:hypothetical protein